MSDVKADLMLHPIRLRILSELVGKQMSTRQISEALPDIAQATLYRHINVLVDGQMLEVVAEHTVNGAIERIYSVVDGAASISRDELRQLSRGDHMRYFTVFAASLIDTFAEYMDACQLERVGDDGMSYNRVVLYLTDEERTLLNREISRLVGGMMSVAPSPDRKRYTLASMVIPDGRNES